MFIGGASRARDRPRPPANGRPTRPPAGRVQHRRVDAGLGQRVAHRGDVDQRRRARRVVHQHAARLERDLGLAACRARASRRVAATAASRSGAVHVAHDVLQQQPQHHRQAARALRRPIAGRSTIAKVDPPTVSEAGEDASVFSMSASSSRATEDRSRPCRAALQNRPREINPLETSCISRRRRFVAVHSPPRCWPLATGIGAPALAQSPLELKIIAPAAPGGGWDGASRSLQQVMTATGAAKNVQVVNVPGRRRHRRPGPVRQHGEGRRQPDDGDGHHDGRRDPDQQVAGRPRAPSRRSRASPAIRSSSWCRRTRRTSR